MDIQKCELLNLTELGEYLIIAEEITVLSCGASRSFTAESVFSADSLPNYNSNIILEHFTATCRRFTDILAFKDQLQKVLYNNNETLSNDILLQLTSLIIKLQTAAMKLQKIERKLNKSYCVLFTSAQYDLIYSSRHAQPHTNIVRSLCIRAAVLQDKKKLCDNWANYK